MLRLLTRCSIKDKERKLGLSATARPQTIFSPVFSPSYMTNAGATKTATRRIAPTERRNLVDAEEVGGAVVGNGVGGGLKLVTGVGVKTMAGGGVGVGVTRTVGRGVMGICVADPGTQPQGATRGGTAGQKPASMNPRIPAL